MKWRDARRSYNVVSGRGGGGMKLGIGGIAVVIVIGLLLGKSPMEMLGLVQQIEQQSPATQQSAAPNDETTDFVRAILGETEDVWSDIFERAGGQYAAPKLVMFSGQEIGRAHV